MCFWPYDIAPRYRPPPLHCLLRDAVIASLSHRKSNEVEGGRVVCLGNARGGRTRAC